MLVTVSMGVFPVIGMYAPLGMAPLLIVTGLLSLVPTWPARPWTYLATQPFARFALVFLVVGLALSPRAIEPLQSAKVAINFFGLALLGLSLHHYVGGLPIKLRKTLVLAMLGGCVIALIPLTVDIASCGAILAKPIWNEQNLCLGHGFIFKRGLTIPSLILIATLALSSDFARPLRWYIPILGLLALSLWQAIQLEADTLIACHLIGAIVFVAVFIVRTTMIKILTVALIVGILATPLLISSLPSPGSWPDGEQRVPSSLHHRLTIWHFAGQRWQEKPLLGWGLDASREMPGAEERYVVSPADARAQGWSHGYDEQFLPLHPHNVVVQWWLELGLPGGILLVVLGWMVGEALKRLPSQGIRRPLTAMLAAILLIVSLLSFGAWQSWWLSTIWLMVALTAPRSDHG